MSSMDNTQAMMIATLLAEMRRSFLEELPDRCDDLENLVLRLEHGADLQTFNELYRRVHSLKGTGGTQGVPVITSICHHLENRLNSWTENMDVDAALDYIDLLKKVASISGDEPDYRPVENALASLEARKEHTQSTVLIAESSKMMIKLYQGALNAASARSTLVGDGLLALQYLIHGKFDAIIIARELESLNGLAVVAALRASEGPNSDIPVILVTSSREPVPDHLNITRILNRGQKLMSELQGALPQILRLL